MHTMHTFYVLVCACTCVRANTRTRTHLLQNTARLTKLRNIYRALYVHTVAEWVPVRHGNSFSLNFLMCKMRIIKSALYNSIKLSHLNPDSQKGMQPQFCSKESKTGTVHQVAVLPWTVLCSFHCRARPTILGKQKVQTTLLPQSFE